MTDVFLLCISRTPFGPAYPAPRRMTEALCATSKLVMMRNFWASTPAMPLPRPESSLPGFSDKPDCFQNTLYTLDKDKWAARFSIVE